MPPQWHQWLRYTRQQPPSIQEQHAEVRRQHQIRYLAAEADARWEAKPRLTDAPVQATARTPVAALGGRAARGAPPAQESQPEERSRQEEAAAPGLKQEQTQKPVWNDSSKKDPWKQHRRGGPSEEWQPKSWTPPAAPKR